MVQPELALTSFVIPSPDSEPAKVLIVAEARKREQLEELLRGSGASVLRLAEAGGDAPDVIVVCREGPAASLHAEESGSATRPGVIVIGASAATDADVVLPADVLPRELILACQLLTQVVRLRRRLQEGTRLGDTWREQASCDPLTQLPNRRAWEDEVRRRCQIARSSQQPLCVALLDLDYFKQVNDGWGLAAGDQLLAAAAAALRQSLRQDDFVARLGGDEFGLLLSGLDATAAAGVIERVRAGLPARIAQSTPFVTSASVGCCMYDCQSELSAQQLFDRADQARRKAKSQGRDQLVAV
jgi:diguanylate cyclase (GGDEF)-like protein